MNLPFWYNLLMLGLAFVAGRLYPNGWSVLAAFISFLMAVTYCHNEPSSAFKETDDGDH